MKRDLNFGREDYENSIFTEVDDVSRKDVVVIDSDEPLFLLRAQDVLAADLIRAWADKLEKMGGCITTVEDARKRADQMDEWRMENGGQMPSIRRETDETA